MASETIVYVADAGSVAQGNFLWVSSRDATKSSNSPEELAKAIADDLSNGRFVALGYESPLFVPAEAEADKLGQARAGECQVATGNKPFTASAGATVLATGIQSLAWVLREIKELYPAATASTRWADFRANKCKLFVWEAFVSGSEKAYPPSHAGDAALAMAAFIQVAQKAENPSRINCGQAFSLAGAAVLWAKLSDDLGLLAEPCVVLRPLFPPNESKARLTGYKLRQAEEKNRKKKVGAA